MRYLPKSNKRFYTVKFFVFLLFLTSCIRDGSGSANLNLPQNPGKALTGSASTAGAAGQKIDTSADKISSSAHSVKDNANLVESKVEGSSREKVSPHLNLIKAEATEILTEVSKVREAGVDVSKLAVSLQNLALDVQTLSKRALDLEGQNDSLKEELEQAQNDRNQALRRAMLYMILAGTIIIAICVTLFFTGNPKAIGGAIAGIVLISVAIGIMAITKYMWLFGLVGSIGALVVLGVMIYHVVDYINHKKGLEEVVHTGEIAKKEMSEEIREKVFGTEGESGRAGQIQSKTTESLVKSVKSKLSGK